MLPLIMRTSYILPQTASEVGGPQRTHSGLNVYDKLGKLGKLYCSFARLLVCSFARFSMLRIEFKVL